MKEYATLFTGGDLFGIGAEQAGLSPSWGVECDSRIADFAELNTSAWVIRTRVEDVDYSRLARPFWLHMSPVCKNASQAKKDGEESAEDIASASACARAVDALQPPEVSLENVYGYRNFESFRIILRALERNGYAFNYWHLNAADYGVPQTRQRLILLASKTHRPARPQATHRKGGDMFLPRWVGWYEAIEDLIPTLPESKFVEWQLKRLRKIGFIKEGRSFAVNGSGNQLGMAGGGSVTVRCGCEPFFTDTCSYLKHPARAFIAQGTSTLEVREAGEPSASVMASVHTKAARPRAFLACVNGEASDMRESDEPSPTLATAHREGKYRAFIAHPSADNERFVVRTDDEPTFTQTNTAGTPRAWLEQGRVVSMTPRALARFQSVPDSYVLPDMPGLACLIIGNGVPSLFARRIIESRL